MDNSASKLEDIFLAAVELGSLEEREQYLDDVCGDNVALRQEVEELLQSHDSAGSFMQDDADPEATQILSEFKGMVGTTIGPYKLLEQIGEGGMGVVFRAAQSEPMKREVALKVIKPGMDSKEVLSRFEAERQALAMMDHPHIAKVLDAGTTESGRPFFVMELVKGWPITKFCDREQLSLNERLNLFRTVCDAVQHAHQKGILHRDIKPSNVLVSVANGKPSVKVIDFGVAKALHHKLTDNTLWTSLQQVVGTPMYMSPEQADQAGVGYDIDTRTDIYSLGVLLYELLTGSTPFSREELKKAGIDEIRRIIREQEPAKPSTKISTLGETLPSVAAVRKLEPKRLSAFMRGDLDWIVMKALEKDRERRYTTADALAEDLERYLEHEPVEAGPPSKLYRFRKFARRNRGQLITAFVIASALFISSGVIINARAQKQQQRQTYLVNVDQALTSAQTAIQADDLSLAAQHTVEAAALIQQLQFSDNRLQQKLVELEAEIEERQDLSDRVQKFRELARQAQENMGYSTTLGGDEVAYEALALFGVLDNDRWWESIEDGYLEEGEIEELREDVYELLVSMADFLVRWSKHNQDPEMLQQCRKFLTLAEVCWEPSRAFYFVRSEYHAKMQDDAASNEDRKRYQSMEARTAWDYYLPGHTAGWRGDLDGAIEAYENALRIQPDHFNSLFFLAMRLNRKERYAEASQVYRACLVIRPEHVPTLRNRALVLTKLEKYEEAEELSRKGLRIAPDDHIAHYNLGVIYQSLNKHDQAELWYRKAIELSPNDASAHNNLGIILFRNEQLKEAEACFLKAIKFDPKLAMAHNNLGACYSRLGQSEKALLYQRKAIVLAPKYVDGHINLGIDLMENGKLPEAKESLNKAIALEPMNSQAHGILGIVLHRQQQYEEAIAEYQRAIELGAVNDGVYLDLAKAFIDTGHVEKGLSQLQSVTEQNPQDWKSFNTLAWQLVTLSPVEYRDPVRAVKLARKAVELSPENENCWNTLGVACYRSKNYSEAISAFRKSIELSDGGSAYDFTFLAMTEWQLGNTDEAMKWARKATALSLKEKHDEELLSFLVEMETLLGLLPDERKQRVYEYYSSQLKEDPDNQETLEARAELSFSMREWDRVSADLEKLAELTGDLLPKRWHQLAISYNHQRKHLLALEVVDRIPEPRRTAPVLHQQAAALYGLERYEECLEFASQAIKMSPDYPYAYAIRAQVYLRWKQWSNALEDYQKYSQERPNSVHGLSAEAFLQVKLGNQKRYQEVCQRMLDLYLENSSPGFGVWLIGIGGFSDVPEEMLNRFIEIGVQLKEDGQDSHHVERNLGVLFYRRQKFQQAAQHIEKAMELDRDDVRNQLWMAITRQHLGEISEAQKWLEIAQSNIDAKSMVWPPWVSSMEAFLFLEEANTLIGVSETNVVKPSPLIAPRPQNVSKRGEEVQQNGR